MKYIQIEELEIRKFQNLLDGVTEENNSVIAEIELMAIDQVSMYLDGKYDTEYIFNQTGSKRTPLIKRLVMDYMLCFLYERTNSNEVPDSLVERCDKNDKLLLDISKGLLSPNLPSKDPTLESVVGFQGGSESVFNDTNKI